VVGLDGSSVLAVVVTHDPGRWFEATLDALAAQDHPDLRVVVVDTGIGDLAELTDRVRARLPEALVHRVDGDRRRLGFGRAANLALDVVDDVDHVLLCHDDVVPATGAVSAMVAAADTWDAGIVGPKLVAWDEPRRLLQLGLGVDRVGRPVAYVDPGDLDQGQHDDVREVFAVPGACTLVRADLFGRVGGFDEAVTFLFDDVSLCWRARIAGARVILAPAARVRHRQGLAERLPEATRRHLARRHRLRVVLSCYGRRRLAALAPRLVAGTAFDVVRALLVAQPARAAVALRAWAWNLRRLRSLLYARRQVRRFRQVPDADVVRAQLPAMARAPLSFRRQVAVADTGDTGDTGDGADSADGTTAGARRAAGTGRRSAGGRGATRWTTGAALLAVLVAGTLAMGSRHLVTRGVPVVGELLPLGAPGDLARHWWDGVRGGGAWPDATVPTLLGALAGLGGLVAGHTDLLRTVLVVGLVPLGVLGAFRLLRPVGSARAPAVAALAYAAVPVPYVALGQGRWAPLVLYAAAPWMLAGLTAASGAAPFGPLSAPSAAAARGRRFPVAVLRAGLATALASLLVPVAPLLLVGMALALALGALLGLAWRVALRLVVAALGAVAVAVVLHLPWSAGVLRSLGSSGASDVAGTWPGMTSGACGAAGAGSCAAGPIAPGDLLRLTAGAGSSSAGAGGTALTCGLLGAAVVVVLVGRRWRLAWGVRAWALALAAGGTAWAVVALDPTTPVVAPELLLVLAGAGVALAIGLGTAAVERDVAGRGRRLGLRRLVTVAGLGALVAGVLPLVQRSFEGDWDMATGDFGYLLASQLDAADGGGQAPILWVGDPAVLPGRGRPLAGQDGVAYLTTRGAPRAESLLPGAPDPTTLAIGTAVDAALTGQTARLGAALASVDIRYVVVPQRLAPSAFDTHVEARVPDVVAAFGGQLDLRRVDADTALVVYENQATSPLLRALGAPLAGPAWSSPSGTGAAVPDRAPVTTSTWRPLLLGLQASLWLTALVVLARQRPARRRPSLAVTRVARPREAVRLILPEVARLDAVDILDIDDDDLGWTDPHPDRRLPVGAGHHQA
jgi:GT2 family glycosyltransferase